MFAENEDSERIDAEFVFIVMRILLDPANLPPRETSLILEPYIEHFKGTGSTVEYASKNEDKEKDEEHGNYF